MKFLSYLFECARCKDTKKWVEPNPIRVNLGKYKGKLLCIECAEIEEKVYEAEKAKV